MHRELIRDLNKITEEGGYRAGVAYLEERPNVYRAILSEGNKSLLSDDSLLAMLLAFPNGLKED